MQEEVGTPDGGCFLYQGGGVFVVQKNKNKLGVQKIKTNWEYRKIKTKLRAQYCLCKLVCMQASESHLAYLGGAGAVGFRFDRKRTLLMSDRGANCCPSYLSSLALCGALFTYRRGASVADPGQHLHLVAQGAPNGC